MAEPEDLDPGTASPFDDGADPFGTLGGDPEATDDTAPADEASATAADERAAPADDTLIDPATLPDELKPHWARMTRAYNKRLERLRTTERDLRGKADLVDRFYTDPAYAQQVIQDYQRRLGGNAPAPNGNPPAAPSSTGGGAQDAAAQAALQALPAELHFLAPAIAQAAKAMADEAVAPMRRERDAERRQASDREYAEMEAALSETVPGWEELEDDMAERISFLKAALGGQGPLRHPRFGSVLDMMYQLSAGPGRATATAADRMRRAVLNRTTPPAASRTPAPDTQALIKQAGSMQDKIAIALRAAVQEVRSGG